MSGISCPNCASPDIVDFELAPKGEVLRFSHCRHCEHRWWETANQGESIRLPDVLDRIGTS